MNIPNLQITQTFGQISLQQKQASIEIQQSKVRMDMESEAPVVEIDKSSGSLQIDQSKSWAAYGSMPSTQMSARISSQARSLANQGIAKTARNGDRFAAIHQSTNVVAEIASKVYLERPNISYVGSASTFNVDVSYTPDQISVRPIQGVVEIQVDTQKPIIRSNPAQVNIGMERYASIQIDWVGSHVDQRL